MPWKECHVMDERLRFVARLLEGETMAPLCAEFGISRKTGYKIFDRYKDCGVQAFSDRSHRAHRQANRLPAWPDHAPRIGSATLLSWIAHCWCKPASKCRLRPARLRRPQGNVSSLGNTETFVDQEDPLREVLAFPDDEDPYSCVETRRQP